MLILPYCSIDSKQPNPNALNELIPVYKTHWDPKNDHLIIWSRLLTRVLEFLWVVLKHVQQTWRTKRPKTVVNHDLRNPPQPPKNEFAKGCSKSNSTLKPEDFFKALCPEWLQRERKDDVIWSDLKLGSHLELYRTLFQSWSKIRSNYKLPFIIITNISRSSPHTTSRFIEVEINILRLTLKICSLICTSRSWVRQISNFKFSAFFRVLFALKMAHPKNQKTPRVSTELEMVVNLSCSFIPLQKIWQEGVDRPVESPQKRTKNFKMAPNAPSKFYSRMRCLMPSADSPPYFPKEIRT